MSHNLTADESLELEAMSDVSLELLPEINEDPHFHQEDCCEYLFIFIIISFSITPHLLQL